MSEIFAVLHDMPGRAIRHLRDSEGRAILPVEQVLDFAREPADFVHIMDRGEVVFAGQGQDPDNDNVRRHLVV